MGPNPFEDEQIGKEFRGAPHTNSQPAPREAERPPAAAQADAPRDDEDERPETD